MLNMPKSAYAAAPKHKPIVDSILRPGVSQIKFLKSKVVERDPFCITTVPNFVAIGHTVAQRPQHFSETSIVSLVKIM